MVLHARLMRGLLYQAVVPHDHGPAKTIDNRYHHWSQLRFWQRIFE
jgi:hypothetical protein